MQTQQTGSGRTSAAQTPSPYTLQVRRLCSAEATKRGLGAVLLRKPQKLARLVAGIAAGSPIPFTVKLRIGTGEKGSNINILEVCSVLGRHCSCCTFVPAQESSWHAELVQLAGSQSHARLVCLKLKLCRCPECPARDQCCTERCGQCQSDNALHCCRAAFAPQKGKADHALRCCR